MKLARGGLRFGSQLGGELDFAAALAVRVENRAARDGDVEHFFQTKGLGAELDFVVVPPMFPAAAFMGRVLPRACSAGTFLERSFIPKKASPAA